MRRIVFNGKFLRASMTGVHRVAIEQVNALADMAAARDPAVADLDMVLAVPAEAEAAARRLARMPITVLTPLSSIPWEQLTLPLRRERGALLVNLCNIGPLLSANAVTMFHDLQVRLTPESYRPAFRYWYRFAQPVLARRGRMILTVSDYSKREIVRAGLCPEGRVAVIPNGADHILRVAPEPGEPIAAPYVVSFATLQAHKNVAVLLKAFARPELAGVSLVLVGGETREGFEAAGHPVGANIIFAGRVSDGRLRALIEGALCLAFPSTTEGFGLPPLEAMILGCPAIVAPCGALPEMCGDAALYAPPGDAAGWASEIAALAGDDARRRALSQRAAAHAAGFTWRRSATILAQRLASV